MMIPKRATEEQRELFRIAAQRLIDDKANGRKVDPASLQWARDVVAFVKPLGRPLSMGNPSQVVDR